MVIGGEPGREGPHCLNKPARSIPLIAGLVPAIQPLRVGGAKGPFTRRTAGGWITGTRPVMRAHGEGEAWGAMGAGRWLGLDRATSGAETGEGRGLDRAPRQICDRDPPYSVRVTCSTRKHSMTSPARMSS